MLHGNVKNLQRDSKKMEIESRAVAVALECHSSFISGLCCTGKCFCYSKIFIFIFLVALWRCCSQLIVDDALGMTSSAHISKQTAGMPVLCVLNFRCFLLKRNSLGRNQVRFKSKMCKRDENLIALIYFLYTLRVLKIILNLACQILPQPLC